MSPLDARVMSLFDTVEEKYHQRDMDNIYKSNAFFKAEYNHKKKVLTRGVRSKVSRGILPFIEQEQLSSRKLHIDTRGKSKVAVLK